MCLAGQQSQCQGREGRITFRNDLKYWGVFPLGWQLKEYSCPWRVIGTNSWRLGELCPVLVRLFHRDVQGQCVWLQLPYLHWHPTQQRKSNLQQWQGFQSGLVSELRKKVKHVKICYCWFLTSDFSSGASRGKVCDTVPRYHFFREDRYCGIPPEGSVYKPGSYCRASDKGQMFWPIITESFMIILEREGVLIFVISIGGKL